VARAASARAAEAGVLAATAGGAEAAVPAATAGCAVEVTAPSPFGQAQVEKNQVNEIRGEAESANEGAMTQCPIEVAPIVESWRMVKIQ
jgi:hypothetical protein